MRSVRQAMSQFIGGVVMVAAATGCATTTPSAERTGERLAVNGHDVPYDAYLDSRGEYHPPGKRWKFDSFTQGETVVDELTFFHVAGDTENEARVRTWREKFNMSVLVGWGVTGAGIAALLGGVGLYAAAGDAANADDFFSSTQGQVAGGLMAGGGIAVGASFLLATMVGPEEPLNTDELVLNPLEEGRTAAARANGDVDSGSATDGDGAVDADGTDGADGDAPAEG